MSKPVFKKTVVKSESRDFYYSSEKIPTHIRYEFRGAYQKVPNGASFGFSFAVEAVFTPDGDVDDDTGRPKDCSYYEIRLVISGEATKFFHQNFKEYAYK